MSLLKKLFKRHKKEKEQKSLSIYNDGIKNSEAMMPKEENLEDCLKIHPEGDYIVKENGDVYLRYIVSDTDKNANKYELPK